MKHQFDCPQCGAQIDLLSTTSWWCPECSSAGVIPLEETPLVRDEDEEGFEILHTSLLDEEELEEDFEFLNPEDAEELPEVDEWGACSYERDSWEPSLN